MSPASPHGEEDFLKGVLAPLPIAQDADQEGQQAVRVPPDEPFQRLPIIVGDLAHQFGVGGLVGQHPVGLRLLDSYPLLCASDERRCTESGKKLG
jgi:hypothetical protein